MNPSSKNKYKLKRNSNIFNTYSPLFEKRAFYHHYIQQQSIKHRNKLAYNFSLDADKI